MYFFMISIYFLSFLSLGALLLTGLQGYFSFGLFGAGHPTFAFATAIIYLFTEVLVMFFFVGTGISIRDYIKEKGANHEFHKQSIAIKRKLYPPTLLNVFIIMAAFITGGGADTGVLPGWSHGLLFLIGFLHYLKTLKVQHLCFQDNTQIILEMTNPTNDTEG